jgi:hypothetical protein
MDQIDFAFQPVIKALSVFNRTEVLNQVKKGKVSFLLSADTLIGLLKILK